MKADRLKILSLSALAAVASVAGVPVAAQLRTAQVSPRAEQMQARHEMAVLEGVLENAVHYGAQMFTQREQASNVPDMVMLTGMARARGFRLEGYGVLFDVEFPSIRRSVMWSMRALQRPDPELLAALQELRKNTQSVTDPRARQELDRAIRDFEAQLKAFDAQANARPAPQPMSGGARQGAAVAPMSTANAAVPPADPATVRALYMAEMTGALVDAILDHGAPIAIEPDQWLTVAARESADRRFVADDPGDTVMTVILRIKGSDLNALRDRRLTRDEARKRVEIQQY